MSKPTTRDEALEQGFIVDRSCYPWVAYKGARFSSDSDWHPILTDLEAHLLTALRRSGEYVRATHGTMSNPNNIVKPDLDLVDAAIARAEAR